MSLFKKMNTKIEEINDEKEEDLTLKKLYLWTLEPIERMKWLANACEAIYSKYSLSYHLPSSLLSSFTWDSYNFTTLFLRKLLWC